MSNKFAHLKKPAKSDPTAFIAAAADRLEGIDSSVQSATGAKKEKFLLSISPADNTLIVQISNRPDDFKCSKAAVVVAAVRAFNKLPIEQQIELLRSV